MKKYILIFFFMLIFGLYGNVYAEAAIEAEFDDASVIVVMKPRNLGINLYSSNSNFGKLGISEVENLNKNTYEGISMFSMSNEEEVLKLTLEEPGRDNVLEIIDRLNKLYDVKYAEPNYIYQLSDMPDDEYYISGKLYGLDKINAPAVWKLDIDCEDIAVAVLDSGVMINHPDLKGNIWTNTGEIPNNGIDDDGNGYIDDVHGWNACENSNNVSDSIGHGTHVAGIISASTNNGIGVSSLARNAKIAPIKVVDSNGVIKTEYLYKALKYVEQMDFPVVNNSYGGIGESRILETIKKCTNSVFVAAAGNDNSDNDVNPVYPASYDSSNIIAVAASDENDNLSDMGYDKTGKHKASNYGVKSVDIAAPGSNIISTYNTSAYPYAGMSGTSMACPMVSSAAAIIKAHYPYMTPEEIIIQLENSVDSIDGLNGKIKTGGRLNAYEMLMIHASKVNLDNISLRLKKGDVFTLVASPYPENTTDIALWKSGDTSIASVENGMITAKECGDTIVTVTFGNVSADCMVTVEDEISTPTVAPTFHPTPLPMPTLTLEPTLTPTLTPHHTPDITPEPLPSFFPEETPKPSEEEALVRAERDDRQVRIFIDEIIDADNIIIFAAIKENSILKGVLIPEVNDMYAELNVPETMKNMDIEIYVWNKEYKPYIEPVKDIPYTVNNA